MRLTLPQLHWYLLDKGFLEAGSLLRGDYVASQMQTRNLIFRVQRLEAPSLFVKQLISFDASNTYVLQKDATCLWLIKNHPALAGLAAYVPGYYGFDAERQVLVTEYLAEATNLEEVARQHGGTLPQAVAGLLPELLASYHFALPGDVLRSRPVQFFPRQVPWVLALAQAEATTQQLLRTTTQGLNPALAAVQSSADFCRELAALHEAWGGNSLLHGDVKWMNLLLLNAADGPCLRIIDWEIADIGDPLWDVGGLVQSFLAGVVHYDPVLSAPGFGLVPGVELAHLAPAWPAVRRLWQRYAALMGLDPAGPALEKVLRYAAARLLQTAIEQSMASDTLQPTPTKLLQASYALLRGLPAVLPHLAPPAEALAA
ncbi:phosphotransferase family protein [Hymenobacter cheonanensis]|uniref:phosphotransferase family protein n=1 Tax=Hymenobacter sp. CA2-7 TaxID=3063993 RepID=UPI002713E589|nr:phosphotransferase [Hymenobacter sp. CA2-7]MDO7884225.1 phosphotransferase [Hymenobacter sp. CA2-7]